MHPSVHLTAESSSAVCIICEVWLHGVHHTSESITYEVSVLIRSFTNAISLWCLNIFIWNWYCKSQIVQGIFFTSKFFEKMKLKDVASTKTWKTDTFESVWLCGVHLAVCIPPRSQGHQISQKTLGCPSHRRVKLRGVLPTAESDSKVCITPLSQAPLCASYRGVKLRGVHHTVESKSKYLRVSGCL